MNATKQFKRVLSAVLVLVMLFTLAPVSALAAESKAVDSVVFFSDLHSHSGDAKGTLVKSIFGSVKNGVAAPVSGVFSIGDVFSSNNSQNISSLATITSNIRTGLDDNSVDVHYAWSDHDRYGGIENYTGLVYGAGADGIYGNADDDNYYVYFISMSDMTTDPRYGITTTFDSSKLTAFTNAVSQLDQSKPLFVGTHQPLFDRRNDNGHAYEWYQVISAAAENMDVAVFHGHNHKYDQLSDYYFAKGSTMSVCCDKSGNAKDVTINFTHLCAGYMEPKSSTSYSSSTSRMEVALAVTIFEDSIRYTTYGTNGQQTSGIAPIDVTVKRDHAQAGTVEPEVTEPTTAPTEPEVTEPTTAPTEPEITEPTTAPTEPEETEPTVPEETEPVVPETPGDNWISVSVQDGSDGNTYVLDTDGIDDGAKYLIVAKSYEKALSQAASSGNAVSVTIDGSNAAADAAYGWTFSKSGSDYAIENNGTYLSRSSSKLASSSSAAAWTVTNSGNGQYTITQSGSSSSWWGSSSKYYVRWSNSSGYFQASSSSTDPVRLYKYAGAGTKDIYARLSGDLTQAYTTADGANLNTILNKITVQTSADGKTVDASIPVTADMVSWNAAFDGANAGTYTGTVSYEGENLGNVVVTVTPAHQHAYETVTVAATCTDDGSVTYTCECGDTYTEAIPATGHSYTVTETAATCAQDGSKVYTCECGDTYNEVIPATGKHTYKTTTVEATCENEGSVTEVCDVCGDTKVQTIPAKGHAYTAETTEATCTQEGATVYTCACGDSYTVVIPAKGHVYVAVVTAPTCEQAGYTTYTCVCGDSYTADEVAALGHDYTAVVTAPTCEQAGYTTYTCACGDSYTADQVAALGHDYTAVVTAPTCEQAGYTTYTCACGDSYTADQVAALGHDYTAVVTAPTCEQAGYTTYTCACGDSYTADQVAALGHDYTAEVTEPTCTEDGKTVYTCGTCGHAYSEKIAALGHVYDAVVTAPTCETAGYTTYTCSVCGASYTADQTAALGHSYTAEEADGYMVYTCHCGHSYSEKIENLTYTKVSSISSGNAYVITFKSSNKYYAMSHEDNEISAVQVTVSNNAITSEITEDMVWNYSNSKLSYENNGETYYLYAQSSGWWGWGTPTLTLSTSNSTSISFSSSKVKMSNYYLRYSNGTVSLNRSATTTYFFIEE